MTSRIEVDARGIETVERAVSVGYADLLPDLAP
jgi:hypothetical protein